ncbi:Sec-independent protein translocase protein TatB [Paraurantiacibacter namhicola]|uniref:Sec-independent protein translocase protein TatB n=1 Tax=Paraurantiacibacter namhicola TaxID=645517 RepID=A0A1C7DBC1_9SPHN|nr:Sec-independent protein translocase protein TatB [Paraurantiacibacter namhicola]ANU08583.1 Sec-independent protein translocase protein TatB [Paraurantiacibacter namhicola]
MFDIGAFELLLIVVVAIVVIGPKDMPRAMRTAGRWIGKVRKLSGHFRAGIDAMVRNAEMEEMEQKWKAQNEKIMREYPDGAPAEMEPTGALPGPAAPAADKAGTSPEDRLPEDAAAADSRRAKAAKPLPPASDEPELPLSSQDGQD